MFKVSKSLAPEIVKRLLQFRNEIPYNLRFQFHIPLYEQLLVVQRVLNLLALKFGNLD